RNIADHATAILAKANMQSTFWDEAVNTVAYVLNRVTSGNDPKTPYEKWFGTKPDISHLRIFGSHGQALDNQKHPKFESKTKDVIMLGYNDSPDIYRVFVPSTRTVQTISAVVFDEQPQCKSQFPVKEQIYEISDTESDDTSSSSDSDFELSNKGGSDSHIETSIPQLGTQTNKAKKKRPRKEYKANTERIASLRSAKNAPKSKPTTTTITKASPPKPNIPSPGPSTSVQNRSISSSSASSSVSSDSSESVSSSSSGSSSDDNLVDAADIAVSPDDAYI